MSINVDRVTKLATKINQVEERIAELLMQRDAYVDEMTAMVSSTASNSTTSKKSPTTKNATGSSLGDKIVIWLQTNPGQDLHAIAEALKAEPKKVGLSLYHLVKKGLAFTENGNYFATMPLTSAAKAPLTSDTTDEETSF